MFFQVCKHLLEKLIFWKTAGSQTVDLFTQETLQLLSNEWMHQPSGILVLNYVGLLQDTPAYVIYQTLESVFPHVRVFTDNINKTGFGNLVFIYNF